MSELVDDGESVEKPEEGAEVEESPADPRPFVLASLGLDESFLDLDPAARAEVLADVEGAQLRRHLGRALFYALLLTAFFLCLEGPLLFASCGLVAVIGGRDLGRFAFGRRLLAAARALFLADAEG